ncbi:MAG TPA: hypothetical protein VM529_24100 [Gemmata sp.]|nr:hypothetical protein [Gemmata sp.]
MELLEPWFALDDMATLAAGLERELNAEVAPGHALFGVRVSALARRGDCDDVLFQLHDGTDRVAVVHLTWKRNPPDIPPYPGTTLFTDIEHWLIDGMRRDHEEWLG